MGQLVVGSR